MSIEVKDSLKDRVISYKKRETPDNAARYIQLDRNENTLGCSPEVLRYLASHVENLSIYPDVFATPLRQKLAGLHGVETEQILVGNGSFELIGLIAQIFLNPGDEVVYPSPSFEWYKTASALAGAEIIEVPLEQHTVPLDSICEHLTEKTRIVWLCNPNNPTGTLLSQEALTAFLDAVPPAVLVVADEAYIDFVRGTEAPNLIPEIKQHRNLLLLRTFSKAYGLAGQRVGYLIADKAVVERIIPYKVPPNTNRLGVLAAEVSLDDQAFYRHVLASAAAESEKLYRAFDALGFPYIRSNANFIMFHLKRPSEPVVEALRERRILVRGGAEYGYPEWIRVTIGTAEENGAFLDALGDIVAHQ